MKQREMTSLVIPVHALIQTSVVIPAKAGIQASLVIPAHAGIQHPSQGARP